jgi:hypothetical protein
VDEKKVEAIKMFPGLCLPDNPDRAMQLLVPEGGGRRGGGGGGGDSKDVRAAKDALDEVGVTVHVVSLFLQ